MVVTRTNMHPFWCCFVLLVGLGHAQLTTDQMNALETLRNAVNVSNSLGTFRIVSDELIGFWGEQAVGSIDGYTGAPGEVFVEKDGNVKVKRNLRDIVQEDKTRTEGTFVFNPNARGLHDFHTLQTHVRFQQIGNWNATSKTVYEILQLDGTMWMRVSIASPQIFARVPQGTWFKVRDFQLFRVTPQTSFLRLVNENFLLKLFKVLDENLFKEIYISNVSKVKGGKNEECYKIEYNNVGFTQQTSLVLGVRDFSGFGFSGNFLDNLYNGADISVKCCIDDDGRISSIKPERTNTGIQTRLEGFDFSVFWLSEKNVTLSGYEEGLAELPSPPSAGKLHAPVYVLLVVLLGLLLVV